MIKSKSRYTLALVLVCILLVTSCSESKPNKLNYKIDPFQYTDQAGKPFAFTDLNNKVWVANFIFTHCTTVCPILTSNMAQFVFVGILIWWELRAKHPFIDVRLLASNVALTRTYMRFALLTLCIYTVLYGVTEWISAARGLSSMDAGLLLLPMSALSAIVVGPISGRNLVRGPLIVSARCSIVAYIGVLFLTTSTPMIWIVVITCIFGITMGTMVSGNQTALYTQVPANQIGTASGLFRTFGYIGSIASSALIGIMFHKKVSEYWYASYRHDHGRGQRHCTDYDPCRPPAWGKEQRCERDFMKHTGPMRH